MDVKRAFLHTPMPKEVYIELPPKAKVEGDGDCIGRLLKAMYGTREAPMSWQEHVAEFLMNLGFTRVCGQPCIYRHAKHDVALAVHVDVFLMVGDLKQIEWARDEILKTFECTSKTLGPDHGQHQTVRYLNRVVQWTQHGIVYEPDLRHVQTVLKETGMSQSAPVNTPGVKSGESKFDGFQKRSP